MMAEMLFMDELSIEGGHNSVYVATLLKKSEQKSLVTCNEAFYAGVSCILIP